MSYFVPKFKLKPEPGQPWTRDNHPWPTPETDHIDRLLNEWRDQNVELSRREISYCFSVGKHRNSASSDYTNLKVSLRSDEHVHVTGALGECAVCKYLGIEYVGHVNSFRKADLPFNIEVRTRTEYWHDLKVRPDDEDSRRVVLAICPAIGRPVKVCGWIRADLGKQYGRMIDPREAGLAFHAVPQQALNSMSSLRSIVREEKKRSCAQTPWTLKSSS